VWSSPRTPGTPPSRCGIDLKPAKPASAHVGRA
jgi:hypothetical protein